MVSAAIQEGRTRWWMGGMMVSGEGTAATEDMKSIRDWCSRGRTITDGISMREAS
jgi:hypothetical protein